MAGGLALVTLAALALFVPFFIEHRRDCIGYHDNPRYHSANCADLADVIVILGSALPFLLLATVITCVILYRTRRHRP